MFKFEIKGIKKKKIPMTIISILKRRDKICFWFHAKEDIPKKNNISENEITKVIYYWKILIL